MLEEVPAVAAVDQTLRIPGWSAAIWSMSRVAATESCTPAAGTSIARRRSSVSVTMLRDSQMAAWPSRGSRGRIWTAD
jgi:hypothetical protein